MIAQIDLYQEKMSQSHYCMKQGLYNHAVWDGNPGKCMYKFYVIRD